MRRHLAWILALLLLLGACSTPEPAPTPTVEIPSAPQAATATPFEPDPTATEVKATNTPPPSPTPLIEAYGPDNFPSNINPLTGLPVEDPSLLERRPVAVKITLMPRSSRPQYSLSMADLVFEFYQNGGISRFHAIFYGVDVEQAGPVRSARFPDENMIRMYKSVFAFGSGDARVLNRFGFAEYSPYLVSEYPAACGPMCRLDPNGKNHLIANTKDLTDYIRGLGLENSRQNLDGMRFDPDVPSGGTALAQLYVRYGPQIYSRWDYDPTTNRYLRFQDTQDDLGIGEAYGPLIDQTNDQQIAADNVVVVLVPHDYFSQEPEIIEIRMVGSGQAFALRDGQLFELSWNVPTINTVLSLTYPDGSPYPFKPGNTWFYLLGQTSQKTEPEPGALRFSYRIP
jgi:hypothetical protein